MALFQGPITLYFALQLDRMQQHLPHQSSGDFSNSANGNATVKNGSATKQPRHHIRPLGLVWSLVAYPCLLCALLWMTWECINLYFCYGAVALVLSPKSSWTFAVIAWLLYRLHWIELRRASKTNGDKS